MAATDTLTALIGPSIEGLGYELWGVERLGGGGAITLRIYIDHPEGITVDDCERVSHQVSGVLDLEDPIRAAYTLEVSSPGVDRPFFSAEQCADYVGEELNLSLARPVEGRRRLRGRLEAVEGDTLRVEVDAQTQNIEFSNVLKARLLPDWSKLGQ